MRLDDIVLLTAENYGKLYKSEWQRQQAIDMLQTRALLPLTIGTLTTPVGASLMYLASQVYWRGCVDNRCLARVMGSEDYLAKVAAELESLNIRLRYAHGELQPESSGAFGRLLYAMGIPKRAHDVQANTPERTLPRYICQIVRARTNFRDQSHNHRTALLNAFADSMFQARFKHGDEKTNGHNYFLSLMSHATEKTARAYGRSVIHLLSELRPHLKSRSPFTDAQIKTPSAGQGAFYCRIYFKNEQLGAFATGRYPLVDMKPIS